MKKVRTRVPRSIILTCTVNSAMLIVFATILLFYMGPLEEVTATPLPLLWILHGITGSKVAANTLTSLIAVIFFFALFNIFASVSRLVWVFARDNGLPFSNFFAYVSYTICHPSTSPANTLGSGSPHPQATCQCAPPCGFNRDSSIFDLYRQRNSVQRPHLSTSTRASHLVLLPHPVYTTSKAPWTAPTIRTLQDGCNWHSCQHCCALLPDLCGPLDAIPTDLASQQG